jgi:hypothetical protein
MNATETKPSMNGVVKISRRGRIKIEFDEADGPFEVDVIEVYDQWHEIDWQLRDEKGNLSHDKQNEWGENRRRFVQSIVNDGYKKLDKNAPEISRAEAEAFIFEIITKAAELRSFFSPKKEETSSSLPSSETRINFSQ